MNDATSELWRGAVVRAELRPTHGREQSRRRPALVVASDLFLQQADTLAIIVPASSTDRGWPNHVPLRGPGLVLNQPTIALTEQPRTVARDRFVGTIGTVDTETMHEVDRWLCDFLALP